ncbi:MAG: hypothetical protein V4714_18550 [Bacteroidota bacterium]
MIKNSAVFCVILYFLASCDWIEKIVCGEPSGEHKAFIDRINKQHSNKLSVTQVPCYPGYFQINCKSSVSSELLDEIDSSARKLDWNEILVYDKENKLIRGNTGSM